jgi:hypothetical protein
MQQSCNILEAVHFKWRNPSGLQGMDFQGAGVRTTTPVVALMAAGLVACAPAHPDAANGAPHAAITPPAPSRRSGLWEQTVLRDGKVSHGYAFQICLDKARQDRSWVFGDTGAAEHCERQISRGADGAYRFASSCRLGGQAVLTSTGVATGDFVSRYEVRSVLTVTGAPFAELDGRHEVQLVGRYRGACPTGMAPGQISLGRGLKVDARRLPQLASAFVGA